MTAVEGGLPTMSDGWDKVKEAITDYMKEEVDRREKEQEEWRNDPANVNHDPFSSGHRVEWAQSDKKFEEEIKERLTEAVESLKKTSGDGD